MMIWRRSQKKLTALGEAQNSANCSGVVSNISGGEARWRWRLEGEVSPVRVSMRRSSPISATGPVRLRATSTESAFSGEI